MGNSNLTGILYFYLLIWQFHLVARLILNTLFAPSSGQMLNPGRIDSVGFLPGYSDGSKEGQ